MNLPNKLTVTRLILSPVFFVFFFSVDFVKSMNPVVYTVILAFIYGIMELTDLLDGKIARKHNLVTDLGKVMDPFGDVIAHLTFFTCLLIAGIMPGWTFMVIIWREFAQSFTRMLLMGKGKPMAANIFGKAKTCLYAACCLGGFILRCLQIIKPSLSWFEIYGTVLTVMFAAAAFASAMSYIIYIMNIKDSGVLKDMTR